MKGGYNCHTSLNPVNDLTDPWKWREATTAGICSAFLQSLRDLCKWMDYNKAVVSKPSFHLSVRLPVRSPNHSDCLQYCQASNRVDKYSASECTCKHFGIGSIRIQEHLLSAVRVLEASRLSSNSRFCLGWSHTKRVSLMWNFGWSTGDSSDKALRSNFFLTPLSQARCEKTSDEDSEKFRRIFLRINQLNLAWLLAIRNSLALP